MRTVSMIRSVWSVLALAALTAGPFATPASAATTLPISKAQQALDRALAHDMAQAGGADSALVVDMRTGQILFSAAPNASRLPASVEKLYTTTTALLQVRR